MLADGMSYGASPWETSLKIPVEMGDHRAFRLACRQRRYGLDQELAALDL